MKLIHALYAAIHALMALAFAVASIVLVVIAARAGWGAVMQGLDLPAAEAIIEAVGLLMAGWGIFIRLNRYAEELEPEAMAEAKSEDHKLK